MNLNKNILLGGVWGTGILGNNGSHATHWSKSIYLTRGLNMASRGYSKHLRKSYEAQ